MIDGLKPYRAMKDSGVPWLGKVPEHWEVKRNKIFLHEVNARSEDGSEELLTVSQYTGVTRRRERMSDDGDLLTNAASLVGYKRVSAGDLVMNIMLAWNGSLGVSAIEGIASPAYCVFRADISVEPMFLHHLFRTPLFTGVFKTVSTGVVDSRLRLYPDLFLRLPSLLPLPHEQSAIVRFLDHVDRRIRHYIRAKQRMIKLLEEQKQAIIHRAVTRGLDPDVRLKPSGISWLGDIPQHWEVVRSGSIFRLFGGFAFPGNGFIRDRSNEALPILLTPVNFDPLGGLRFGSKSTVRFQGDVPEQFRLRKGALVTVLTDLSSKRLILGRAGFIEHDGVLLNQRTARVDVHASIKPRINTQYLCWVINSCPVREQTIATSRGATVFHTSPTRMLAARWPLPPLDEQNKIVEQLEALEKAHRPAYEKLGQEIERLREYRTRLFSDVVTGKLDVRKAAAKLPDEAEDLEVLDTVEDLDGTEDMADDVASDDETEGAAA
jgi:type I restriction enzyme, S subunit